jgi:hypothetical protein
MSQHRRTKELSAAGRRIRNCQRSRIVVEDEKRGLAGPLVRVQRGAGGSLEECDRHGQVGPAQPRTPLLLG